MKTHALTVKGGVVEKDVTTSKRTLKGAAT
jgi:hypothetical protein